MQRQYMDGKARCRFAVGMCSRATKRARHSTIHAVPHPHQGILIFAGRILYYKY
jgi:hypothetical protein